jgi:DNA-directed RNA polymerase subunit RPC12/RpoP
MSENAAQQRECGCWSDAAIRDGLCTRCGNPVSPQVIASASQRRPQRPPPWSPEARQLLRDYRCPYCKSSLEGQGAGRFRKRCTECGVSFTIPRKAAGAVPGKREGKGAG